MNLWVWQVVVLRSARMMVVASLTVLGVAKCFSHPGSIDPRLYYLGSVLELALAIMCLTRVWRAAMNLVALLMFAYMVASGSGAFEHCRCLGSILAMGPGDRVWLAAAIGILAVISTFGSGGEKHAAESDNNRLSIP